MLLALSELEENAGGNIAAVSHGGSINAVLHRLSGGEFGSGKTRLKNACINVLSLDDGKLQVLDYNLAPSEFAEKYR
jgi:broad specificity phosphatase PhoE